jgi:hypothetical protein
MPVVLKIEPEPKVDIKESLDKNETVVTEPVPEVKPVIEVPSKESLSFNIPKNYDGDFLAEGITIVLICAVLYGLFQLVVMLIPLLVSLAFVGGIGYLGYLLM